MRKLLANVLAGLAVAISTAVPAETFKSAGGLAIYLGVMPAAMLQGHEREHPEAKMHSGVPRRRQQQHIVVAIFDAASGTRIDEAVVTATVIEPGLSRFTKRLEPMPIAGSMSFGNYFDMPSKGTYRIQVQVFPAGGRTVDVAFQYEHVP